MPRIGIIYHPSTPLYDSGLNQTAILLGEFFQHLTGYEVIFVDPRNSEQDWWADFPKISHTQCADLHTISKSKSLDLLIDIDGKVSTDYRERSSVKTVVFLRDFLQFTEMDQSVYIERPYIARSLEHICEIWCWDLLNPVETIPSIQTLFPCPIRRIPFMWSSTISNHFLTKSFFVDQEWVVHIAEKNTENTSSSVIPLVSIYEMERQPDKQKHPIRYEIHNADTIKENRFLKENVLNNIQIDKLPVMFVPNEPFQNWPSNSILLSHSRFVPMRITLLQAIWMGIPVIHNSPVIRSIHPQLDQLFYPSNRIQKAQEVLHQFISDPHEWYRALPMIREAIVTQFAFPSTAPWLTTLFDSAITKEPLLVKSKCISKLPEPVKKHTQVSHEKEIIIGFSDMWSGFNCTTNFFIDSLCHEFPTQSIRGEAYTSTLDPHLLIFGPFGSMWKSATCPTIYFCGENPNLFVKPDGNIALHLTCDYQEDTTHLRLPIWMIFIDWFTKSVELPHVDATDNPSRIPLSFAVKPHSIGFKDRTDFCGFVVSNPTCAFRNEAFQLLDAYKHVNSGGALFNNIGGTLLHKYAGGGCGDVAKHLFFSKHRFALTFENSQAAGYITEKLLHAKMAGCVPLYWGDVKTDEDFAPNAFINLSKSCSADSIVTVVKKVEAHPEICEQIAATPLLDEPHKQNALTTISKICKAIMGLLPMKPFETYVINLDKRTDRWDTLLQNEPTLKDVVTRISAVDGRLLPMTQKLYDMFQHNTFQWKKSVIGCWLSHLSVWTKIAMSCKEGFTLVLEDDVRFINKNWHHIIATAPKDAELLYLGGVLPPNRAVLPFVLEPINMEWAKIKPNTYFTSDPLPVFHFCAYSYLLSPAGARKLIQTLTNSVEKACMPCDHFLGHPLVNLVKYTAYPFLAECFQDSDPTYKGAEFNDFMKSAAYDSDIANNIERFEDVELIPFQESIPFILHTFYPEINLYETTWLEYLFSAPIKFKQAQYEMIKPYSWFHVQAPHQERSLQFFQELEQKKIPFCVIHLGDEFGKTDISFYSMKMCKTVIRNYLRPDIPHVSPHVHVIPLGYHHRSDDTMKSFKDRELMWSFHGTEWHDRKNQLQVFSSFVPHSCHLQTEWNSPQGTKEKLYKKIIGQSKFCPILTGNNVETFRFYEALEAGCIPVTTITDPIYLAWIEENMGLASLYPWTRPTEVMDDIDMVKQEALRVEIGKRWETWKKMTQARCLSLMISCHTRSEIN